MCKDIPLNSSGQEDGTRAQRRLALANSSDHKKKKGLATTVLGAGSSAATRIIGAGAASTKNAGKKILGAGSAVAHSKIVGAGTGAGKKILGAGSAVAHTALDVGTAATKSSFIVAECAASKVIGVDNVLKAEHKVFAAANAMKGVLRVKKRSSGSLIDESETEDGEEYEEFVNEEEGLRLFVTLHRGDGLVAKDTNIFGQHVSSDPYVILELWPKGTPPDDEDLESYPCICLGRSPTIKKTLKPVWEHIFVPFSVSFNNLDMEEAQLRVRIMDDDFGLGEDDAMGAFAAYLQPSKTFDIKEKWYAVSALSAKGASGRIQMSFKTKRVMVKTVLGKKKKETSATEPDLSETDEEEAAIQAALAAAELVRNTSGGHKGRHRTNDRSRPSSRRSTGTDDRRRHRPDPRKMQLRRVHSSDELDSKAATACPLRRSESTCSDMNLQGRRSHESRSKDRDSRKRESRSSSNHHKREESEKRSSGSHGSLNRPSTRARVQEGREDGSGKSSRRSPRLIPGQDGEKRRIKSSSIDKVETSSHHSIKRRSSKNKPSDDGSPRQSSNHSSSTSRRLAREGESSSRRRGKAEGRSKGTGSLAKVESVSRKRSKEKESEGSSAPPRRGRSVDDPKRKAAIAQCA